MTHSGGKQHTNIGDRGQRYEVRTTGYPKVENKTVGWAMTVEGAEDMAAAFREHPSCTSTEIFDRQEKQVSHYKVLWNFTLTDIPPHYGMVI